MSDEDSIRVQLAQIAGGVKLIDSKLDASNRIHDERHESIRNELKDQRETLHRHANRIGVLEAARQMVEGEKKGIALSTKVIWAIVTLFAGGVGALLARLLP